MSTNSGKGVKPQNSLFRNTTRALTCVVLLSVSGCAEGYFWKTGKYAPWVRKQWEAEEQVADTLFARKRRMTEAVSAVAGRSVEDQQEVAKKLSEIILRDPIVLLRLHALKLIPSLNCPQTSEILTIASTDPSSDIRTATVKALEKLPGESSVYQLQEIIANDTDDDVRIAATRALSKFSGQASVKALSIALEDRNPALQISATESLMRVTGQSELGRDVTAWQRYVQQAIPQITDPAESESNTRTLIAKPTESDSSLFR